MKPVELHWQPCKEDLKSHTQKREQINIFLKILFDKVFCSQLFIPDSHCSTHGWYGTPPECKKTLLFRDPPDGIEDTGVIPPLVSWNIDKLTVLEVVMTSKVLKRATKCCLSEKIYLADFRLMSFWWGRPLPVCPRKLPSLQPSFQGRPWSENSVGCRRGWRTSQIGMCRHLSIASWSFSTNRVF